LRQQRDDDLGASLFRAHEDHAVADVLADEPRRVAASQASVKQDGQRQPFARPDRPTGLKAGDLFLGPAVEALCLWRTAPNAVGWVDIQNLAFDGQRNRPRMVLRKLLAANGVALRS